MAHIQTLEYPMLSEASQNRARLDEKDDSCAMHCAKVIIRKTCLDADHAQWREALFRAAQR
eukprot:363660-Pyramimonas_sp.AAC.1